MYDNFIRENTKLQYSSCSFLWITFYRSLYFILNIVTFKHATKHLKNMFFVCVKINKSTCCMIPFYQLYYYMLFFGLTFIGIFFAIILLLEKSYKTVYLEIFLLLQVSIASGANTAEINPSINVHFTINQLAVSGLKVNRLDMYGEKYKPFKGVKYITKAGRFQIRMQFWLYTTPFDQI